MAANKLIIVESPAKMKTIQKFLGQGYTVNASMGHVRDLPKSTLGVDASNDFEPKYITIRGKGDILSALKKDVKKADTVYLATDPDREGEAISWHLLYALGLEEKAAKGEVKRITFNEVTKNAVKNAIKAPRSIDMDLVDAQQARRIMDRIVGYSISPILWKKIKRGLSAGRVQSTALNMICRREEEIARFVPQEYWTVEGTFRTGSKEAKAAYYGENGKKVPVVDAALAEKVAGDVRGRELTVTEVKSFDRIKNPPLPFTTSTLQQEASKYLNFSASKTMRIAQRLYEGLEVKGRGSVGLITYLRTDSVRISDEAYASGIRYIEETYGKNYVSGIRPAKKNDTKVQDAHEAIRPTYFDLEPENLKDTLQRDELRLYQMIWNRFFSALMSPAVYRTTSVRMDLDTHTFTASGSQLTFDGFLKLYRNGADEESRQDLSKIQEGMKILFAKLDTQRHETEPPSHFTEAALIRQMEEDDIGRPSTYAPTVTTLLDRHYITREKKNLFVTELGNVVNEFITGSFPDIANVTFTAEMEKKLDRVAEGRLEWKEILRDFYPAFEETVKAVTDNTEKIKVADEVSDVICDKCGRNMVIKYGAHGRFLACPGFPECRNTMPLYDRTGATCPDCGGDIIRLRTRKGRLFYACENKECKYMSWKNPKPENGQREVQEKGQD